MKIKAFFSFRRPYFQNFNRHPYQTEKFFSSFLKNFQTYLKDIYFHITKTRPCNLQQFFTVVKKNNFQMKNYDIFYIFAQNIDCWYTFEPPHLGGSNEYPQFMIQRKIRKIMYTPVNPNFTVVKKDIFG